MKHVVICLLDKEYPPEHAFVNGMLSYELPQAANILVLLIVSRGSSTKSVQRYGRAICIPVLKPRRGLRRFSNIFVLLPLLVKIIKRERSRGKRITLFVRNEPIYLLASSILRSRVDRVIFQQSFPHEIGSPFLKGFIAVQIFRAAAKKVDALLAVNAIGLDRLRKYFGMQPQGLVIPLLGCQDERLSLNTPLSGPSPLELVRFIYTGTHSNGRRLDFVLRSIVSACQKDIKAEFVFYGGSPDELKALRNTEGVSILEKEGIIKFYPTLARNQLLRELASYHVGLCLIPPIPIFKESSPTKLAEYMNHGLAVLANKEIPFQEKLLSESGGGLLVEWSEKAISDAILEFCSRRETNILELRKQALSYAHQKLDYRSYVHDFIQIMEG